MIRINLLLLLLASPAFGGDLLPCQTSMRGQDIQFFYDPGSPALKESLSLRERLLGGRGAITCPGLVTLRAFTPELSDADRAPFCLQWDEAQATYIGYDLGPRDAWLVCRTPRKSFCERVNRSKEAAARWGAAVSGLAVDVGVETAMHAAGVVSVEGPAATIGQSLVGLGATAVEGVGAGAALGAVAVTAVAVGGAIYVCSDSGAEAAAVMPEPERKLQQGEVPPGAALPEGTPPPVQRPAPPTVLPAVPDAAAPGEPRPVPPPSQP